MFHLPIYVLFNPGKEVESKTDNKRLGGGVITVSQRIHISIPGWAKSHLTFASLLMGYWDWKSILNIPCTPQRSQYDISTAKKPTSYYLSEVYKLMTVQFDNWEIQLALSEAGKMDLRGDGIWAMTLREPVNSSKRPDWLQAGVSWGGAEGAGGGWEKPSFRLVASCCSAAKAWRKLIQLLSCWVPTSKYGPFTFLQVNVL